MTILTITVSSLKREEKEKEEEIYDAATRNTPTKQIQVKVKVINCLSHTLKNGLLYKYIQSRCSQESHHWDCLNINVGNDYIHGS